MKLPRNSTIGKFIVEEMFDEIWEDTENTKDFNDIVFRLININNDKNYRVKYIFKNDVFYIQDPELVTDTINGLVSLENAIVTLDDGKIYSLNTKIKQDLPDKVRELFDSKYPETENIFFELISLNN